MKKTIFLMAIMSLLAVGAFAQTATNSNQTTNSNSTTTKQTTTKTPKTKTPKASKTMPTNDADIQQCITNKLAKAPKLSKENLSASVSGGVATLSGTATDSGSKGGATTLAKSCGAKSVTNNITFAGKAKTPKTSNTKNKKTGTTQTSAPPTK